MTMRVHDDWLLTPYRLVIHEPTATAVLADVHLGYGEARRQTGDAVPLLDVAAQLAPLRTARRRFAFDKLVVAGDLFERGARQDLFDQFLRQLHGLAITLAGFAPGNHDRGWESLRHAVPCAPHGVVVGGWRIIHDEASALAGASDPGKRILGHWHPALRHRGRRVPCYLVAADKLVLPAFSADAAGWCIDDEPSCRGFQRLGIIHGRVIDCSASMARMARWHSRSQGGHARRLH